MILAKDCEEGKVYKTITGKKVRIEKNRDEEGQPTFNCAATIEGEESGWISMQSELYELDPSESTTVRTRSQLNLEKLKEQKKDEATQRKKEDKELEEANLARLRETLKPQVQFTSKMDFDGII